MAELDPARGKARQRDWSKRLADGIANMSTTNSAIVSSAELATHGADSSDPWLAVRGIVYSIREYCDVHPGGRRQILRGAGRDATDLFDSFHRWVNADALLAGERIGELRVDSVPKDAGPPAPPAVPPVLQWPQANTGETVQLQWRKRAEDGWSLRLLLPRGTCLGWGMIQQDGYGCPVLGMVCEMSTQWSSQSAQDASSTKDALMVYPRSMPSTEGHCDMHVPGAMCGVESLEAGALLQIRLTTRPLAVGQLGDPGAAKLPALAMQKVAEPFRNLIASGCFCLLRSSPPSKPASWTALWPTGTLAGVKSILCIARGDGILPLLPLLDWAQSLQPTKDGLTPLVWLLWDRSAAHLYSHTQSLSQHIKEHMTQTGSTTSALHKVVEVIPPGTSSRSVSAAVGLCEDEDGDVEGGPLCPWDELVHDPLMPMASPTGLATLCKDAQAPTPESSQIVLCSAGRHAGCDVWLNDWDGVMRANWYLAAHCLQVNH